MNDKAFLPAIPEMIDPEDDVTYAKVAAVVACYAARHGGTGLALELGAMLGLPWRAYELARNMLMEEPCP